MRSIKGRLPRTLAEKLATDLVRLMNPHSEHIAIVGSIRRFKDEVGDIEIILISPERRVQDLFGTNHLTGKPAIAYVMDHEFERFESLGWRRGSKWGDSYRQLYHVEREIPADIYFVPEFRVWGSHMAVRTGPAAFSKFLMQRARQQGMRFMDGFYLHRHKSDCKKGSRCPLIVDTIGEEEVFEALKLGYLTPRQRQEKYGA